MFKRVLIANRGEIALRIIRALRELNITSIAIFSEEDENSLYVKEADESICIGNKRSIDSYLNMENIISAAISVNADAIHPGYGFLSEDYTFSTLCKECNIKFIGPDSRFINLMGNKINARKIMKENKMPVIPGSFNIIKSIDEAKNIINRIGLPVIIKTTTGGGGKGIRVITDFTQLENIIDSVNEELNFSFKDNGIYIEKIINNAKHIEIQIIADNYGNIVALPERDCSLQRNHQKIAEESPCSIISDRERSYLQNITKSALSKVGYNNIGTVEFLMDNDHNFYFLEMNTRIQVEHPVSEEITGIDLVKQQILLSAGEHLNIKQSDIHINGCSIEARINAEDPINDFYPNSGKIQKIVLPMGTGIRNEFGVSSGDKMSPYYDSLLGKIIVHADNRNLAIKRMENALNEFNIKGITINKEFLKWIFKHAYFKSGNYSTTFINNKLINNFKESTSIDNKVNFDRKIHDNLDIGIKYLTSKKIAKQCPRCKKIIYYKNMNKFQICPFCDYGFRVNALDRLHMITDQFKEWDSDIVTTNPLKFPEYSKKIDAAQISTKINESILTGDAIIGKYHVALGIMDPFFIMGSLGAATGEKITKLFDKATTKKLPVIIYTASGGARMQEGTLALMQMAKITQAINRHRNLGLLYISIMMDPTMGGVTASFASQSDFIIAEPNSTIGFAGKRVVEQTTGKIMPSNFQTAESAYKNGFIDAIISRDKQNEFLNNILMINSSLKWCGVSKNE